MIVQAAGVLTMNNERASEPSTAASVPTADLEEQMANNPVVPTSTHREKPPLRLRFEGRATVSTLQDLPTVIERWTSVLSCFSLVTPGSNPRATLLGMMSSHHSLVIDLAVDAGILTHMQVSVQLLRTSLAEATVLAGKIDELRTLNVKAEILKALEEQVRDNRYAAATKIADRIRTESNCDQEAYQALQKALMMMATFLEDGGEIEIAIETSSVGAALNRSQ